MDRLIREKEFDFTTSEGWTFNGYVRHTKWSCGEDRFLVDYDDIYKKGDYDTWRTLETFESTGVDIDNLDFTDELFELFKTEEFWNENEITKKG